VRLVGVGVALAAALLAGADALADGGASSHARLHAAIALGALIAAGAVLRVRPVGGPASRALVIAFVLVAGGQLLEGVGALGYAADNDTRRSDLALAHDAGIAVAPVALLSLAVAVGIAAAARIAPGSRFAAIARGAVFVGVSVVGVVLVAVISGVL
jgi:hypothetical protein